MQQLIGIVKHIRIGRREGALLGAWLILFSIVSPTVNAFMTGRRYILADSTSTLIGGYSHDFANQIKYDAKEQAYTLNADAAASSTSNPLQQLARARATVGAANKASQAPYSLTLHKDFSKGLTMTDANMGISFDIIPQFKAITGQLHDQRVVYPVDGGQQAIYSIKSNGLKEDIVLPTKQDNEMEWKYQLKLPKTLQARLQDDGSVGIFSADPVLFGNISFGSNSDQAKVENAREHAAKDHLVFAIPPPTIKQSGEGAAAASSWFSLGGSDLTIHASGLTKLHYPISVDPSVVVASTSSFLTNANNESNIDYSTANQIARAGMSGGSLAATSWTDNTTAGTNTYTTARSSHGSIAYNGYLYVAGGQTGTSTYTNDVQAAPINADGSLGAWKYTYSSTFNATANATASFTTARAWFQLVAYSGYMYVIAGSPDNTATLSDAQYAKINSDGTVGAWKATTSIPDGRQTAGTLAYNGYMYVLGGYSASLAGDGTNVWYSPINADGSLGAWTSTSQYTTTRECAGYTVYNGYLYVMGGNNVTSGDLSDVQYAPINADGSVGAWKTTTAMPTAREYPAVVAYNGYMYAMTGQTVSGTTTKYNDTKVAPINANGTLGSWITLANSTTASAGSIGAAYNGQLYLTGGNNASGIDMIDTQYVKLSGPGSTSSFKTNSSTYTTTRQGGQVVAYNGYLYELGGVNGSAATTSVYYAPINADGSIGAFLSTTAFTTARAFFGAVVWNGKMYVVGGCSSLLASCTTTTNNVATVYYSTIATNGTLGAWSSTTSFTTARYGMSVLAYNGYLYVMGGLNGSTFKNDIQYGSLISTGAVQTWSTSAKTLPASMAYFGATAYGGNIYLAGGCTAGATTCTTAVNTVSYAPASFGDLSAAFTASGTFTNARGMLGLTAWNGYLYITGGQSNTTYYSDVQYAPISPTNSSVGTWTTGIGSTLSSNRSGVSSTVYDGVLYVTGGYNGSTYYSDTQYATISNSGTGSTGTWSTTTALPSVLEGHSSVVNNGYLYTFGGYTGSFVATVQYAALNTDGTIGAWKSTNSLKAVREQFATTVYNGYVYAFGGDDGSVAYNDVQYAQIQSGGALGPWQYTYNSASSSTFVGGFTTARSGEGAFANNGYVYIFGGSTGTTNLGDSQYAPINADGTIGTWKPSTSLLNIRTNFASVFYNGYVYVLGGNAAAYITSVEYAKVNGDGTLGAWAYTTFLPTARNGVKAVAYNGYIYITGGYDGTTYFNDVQYARINSNGTLGNFVAAPRFTNGRYAHSSVVYNGYIYIIGGENATVYGDVQYAQLNSIAPIARYSKVIDLGTTANLTGISYAGSVPGGAGQITYRAAGTNGIFGAIGQSNGITSTACTSSAANVRYVQVFVNLDDSGAYPGASLSTPANLTSLTVNYLLPHPLPAQRLRAGQTLQNGVLSSLDTCTP